MKVYFIQDNSFLRTAQKTNPFFDPIIKVCEEHGIEWRVLVPELPQECGYDSERIVSFRGLLIVETWFLRLVRLWHRKSLWKMEVLFARIFGRFWARSFKADLYITIAGNMSYEFATIYPRDRVVDLQHGVIYSKHGGYFEAGGRLKESRRVVRNIEYWLYGQGYADCFFKNPENLKDLDGRVKVIGNVVRPWTVAEPETVAVNPSAKRHLIVLANQMTPDDAENGLALKRVYERWLDEMAGVVVAHPDVAVVLRNHPRFGDVVDLSDWKVRYPWLGADQRPFPKVFTESICCVTINSTTVFDAIPYGCPSVLIDGHDVGWMNIMVDEYDYPYGQLTVRALLALSSDEQETVRQRLKKWYNAYYTPFDAERALRLIKGEI